MAGVTDASYRQMIKRIAPEVVVYTEFLSTDAIHYGAKKTMQMIDFDPAVERPFIVQVFGKDPEHFLSAAKVIEELGADGMAWAGTLLAPPEVAVGSAVRTTRQLWSILKS